LTRYDELEARSTMSRLQRCQARAIAYELEHSR